MGIFVYCFTATGKSTLGKMCSNVVDMESTLYKYENTLFENERAKGTERKINKNYPQNYFDALMSVKDKYDYILISDNICDSWLRKNNIEYWQIYPNIELKEEYMQRMKERGNNQNFIDYQAKMWEDWVNGCRNDKFAKKHIELKSGQFLIDVLPNLSFKEKYD